MSQPDLYKIVVLCQSPLGDTLFATPAIRALGENYPKARILILASHPAAKVLKNNPYGIEVVPTRDHWDFLRKLGEVRKEKYQLALGLSQIGSLFTRFCGTSIRSDFYSIDSDEQWSVVRLCLEVLHSLGIASNSEQTEFWIGSGEEPKITQKVINQLSQFGFQRDQPLIAIHCGGHYFVRKRWPLENFIQVIRMIQRKIGFRVVLVGGKEDLENSFLIQNAVPEVLNTTGLLRLEETAALLKQCRLFVGNDSGPLHLAVAVGTPTVGLYGPTSPDQFFPYTGNHRFIHKKYPCSPCYKFGGGIWQQIPKCSRSYCMEAITPERVIGAIEESLINAIPVYNNH